jgi:hypothetical protein
VYQLLSKPFRQITRKIDVCSMPGAESPITLFTVDYDTSNLRTVKDRFRGMKPKMKKEILHKEKM